LHCDILAEFPPPQCELSGFGLIHGDVNPSNYFWDSSSETPHVFDLDQIQFWLYLYDLAGSIWSAVHGWRLGMTSWDKVREFKRELVEASGDADEHVLEALVEMRKFLYHKFCAGAVLELPEGHAIRDFCAGVNEMFRKSDSETTQKSME
jgi:Ser/Thr protein kinase RdoA (MazF antagonist)